MVCEQIDCKESCRCCSGSGTQRHRASGLRVVCPCCGGTGKWRYGPKKEKIYF